MSFRYLFSHKNEKRHSVIIKGDNLFTPSDKKPSTGYSAYTRFFAAIKNKTIQYVVKQPLNKILKHDELIQYYFNCIKNFEREKIIWDLVYPDQKAKLIVDHNELGAIRLVLPYFPGKRLNTYLSAELSSLTYCKILLALINAVRHFYELGLSHNDFNGNNVLIEEKENGTIKAYLIDFDRVSYIKNFASNSEWLVISRMLSDRRYIPHIPDIQYNPGFGYNVGYKDTPIILDFLRNHIVHLESEKFYKNTPN